MENGLQVLNNFNLNIIMPYKLKKFGSKWFVVKKTSGKKMSKKGKTHEAALAHLRALEINVKESYDTIVNKILTEVYDFDTGPDYPEQDFPLDYAFPPHPEPQDLQGWQLADNSYTSKGADPTAVTRWILEKDGKRIEIQEFFGDWSINGKRLKPDFQDKEYRQKSQDYVNQKLIENGAPSFETIEKEIEFRQHSKNQDPYGSIADYM
jgi:hypothetical protein